ncbi:MAG: DUF4214 domain-containing protein [Pseudomonadota bacterium]
MNTLLKLPLFSLLPALLISCGGDPAGTAAAPATQLAAISQNVGAQQAVASDYYTLVEQLYISYFGRPADSSGLTNFAAQLAQLNAPADIQLLSAAYNSSAEIRALIDSFGNSTESQSLYSGDNDAFVNAIFVNVLNRIPQAAGKAFWVDAINSGRLTRANASLSIMAGALINTSAQGLLDAQLIRNRVSVGISFTAALDTPAEVSAYSGQAAAAAARAMLAKVDANTNPGAFQATVDATIAAMLPATPPPPPPGPSFADVRSIINARCVTCHSASFANAGVRLDSDSDIHARAQQIYLQAVVQRTMPFGNATGMTDAERNLIGTWFLAGAN